MNNEEIKHIQDIQGTAGFRVMQYEVGELMKKLDSVRQVNRDGLVAEQTLARQLAYEILEKFLQTINLQASPERDTRRTYE